MGSYVDKVLLPSEDVLYQGKTSKWTLLPYILIGFLLLPLFGLGILFWIAAAIRYYTSELAVTNKRIIAKFGFISRTTIEISLQKTESVQVHQSIFGRICDYGSIIVSGAGNPQAPMPGISNPLGFRHAVLSAQEQEN